MRMNQLGGGAGVCGPPAKISGRFEGCVISWPCDRDLLSRERSGSCKGMLAVNVQCKVNSYVDIGDLPC